jgi:hypothetical protein
MDNETEEKILLWFEKQLNNSLMPRDALELEKIILMDNEAKDFYISLADQHSILKQHQSWNLQKAPLERSKIKTPLYFSAILAALLMVSFLLFSQRPTQNEPIGNISVMENCQWSESTMPLYHGAPLSKGRLKLTQGLLNLKLTSGAELTIEAPADVEFISAMHVHLYSGTALTHAPENAQGFKVTTPATQAVDHGTDFLVSHNVQSGLSLVEVVKGEVQVGEQAKSIQTGESVLVGQKSITSFDGDLVKFNGLNTSSKNQNILVIRTDTGKGAEASIIQNNTEAHSSRSLLLIKNSTTEFKRKIYLKYDLSTIPSDKIDKVGLNLTIRPSGYGFAAYVPDAQFSLYALTSDSLDNWNSESINWQNAPANLPSSNDLNLDFCEKIASFEIKRGVYQGTITIENQRLTDFINNDKNKIVSFILVRETGELSIHGLVHGFASSRNPDGGAPTLSIFTK